ncbi:MAG: hypothetical protein Q8876_06575, partial [Bacillota bacterium]|nr:hypothetical protein [Bacillota bacterium]
PKETTLVLLLGPQTKFENNENKSYENKHVFNKLLIEKSKKLADEFENIKLIEFDKYIKSKSDFTNSPNQFAKRVYFDLANDIIKILDSEQTDYKKSKFEVAFSICISGIKSYLIKIKIIKKLSNLLLKK